MSLPASQMTAKRPSPSPATRGASAAAGPSLTVCSAPDGVPSSLIARSLIPVPLCQTEIQPVVVGASETWLLPVPVLMSFCVPSVVGGVSGGQLAALIPALQSILGAQAGAGGQVANAGAAAVGGGLLTLIVGLIKQSMNKPAA